ncbi:DUF6011 domain-containing protein [Mesoterricola sediminis]|uniref:Uncharacterized protein n=1 Tax=Mesoterricola sediminis TaxID=2927980 RepID=A0AA48KDE5_9BACT|nr:hypothetical protein METESE_11950 [Mesoterricola sediminis]
MPICMRCHRSLKDPQSIDRGFGPHCWALIQQETTELFQGWDEYQTSDALSEKGIA